MFKRLIELNVGRGFQILSMKEDIRIQPAEVWTLEEEEALSTGCYDAGFKGGGRRMWIKSRD